MTAVMTSTFGSPSRETNEVGYPGLSCSAAVGESKSARQALIQIK